MRGLPLWRGAGSHQASKRGRGYVRLITITIIIIIVIIIIDIIIIIIIHRLCSMSIP
jgi:hypothetical protein